MPSLLRLTLRILCVPLPWMFSAFMLLGIRSASFIPSGAITLSLLAGSLLLGIGIGALVWAYTLDPASVQNGYRRNSVATYIIFQLGGIPLILLAIFVASFFLSGP